MMKPQEIIDIAQSTLSDSIVETKTETYQPWIMVKPENIVKVATFFRDDSRLKFDFLRMIAGIDYKETIEMVYELFSYTHHHEFKLKVRVPKENPSMPTTESVWAAANWFEREIYDLLGVTFENHSDLRRLLLPDDWEGHPLRKDYKEKTQYNGVATTRAYLTGMPELPTLPAVASERDTKV